MCIWEFWACEKCLKSYPKCIWHIFCSFAACSLEFYISHHAIKSRIEKQCAKQRKQKFKPKRRKYGIVRPEKSRDREREKRTHSKNRKNTRQQRVEREEGDEGDDGICIIYRIVFYGWCVQCRGQKREKKTKTKQNKIGKNVCLYTMVHSGQWQQQQQH